MKIALGLLFGFLIGALCRFADVPAPAPPTLVGALLVLAMTTGYVLMNRWASHRVAHHRELCGDPNGRPITRSDA